MTDSERRPKSTSKIKEENSVDLTNDHCQTDKSSMPEVSPVILYRIK